MMGLWMLNFTVNGVPVPKMRPRLTRGGHAYTPKETRDYEGIVREAAFNAMRGNELLSGAVRMDVKMFFPIPASWPKKRQDAAKNGELGHCVKPDATNVLKSIEDALNGIAYKDDCQIVAGGFSKHYSERPRVEITVTNADEARL